MKLRKVIIGLLLVICAAAVCGVLAQRQKLAALRANASALNSTQPSATVENQQTAEAPPTETTLTPELLQLRGEVTRLQARQRELAGVPAEGDRLRAQLAVAGTNAPGLRLPPGYLRASAAQMVGYATPESALQSLLWAIRNHDTTNLLQALTPAAAQRLQADLSARTPEVFFQGADKIPGVEIRSQQTMPDGSVEMQVAVIPGDTGQTIRLQQVAGQWKLDGPF